jgi:hypothetical protein
MQGESARHRGRSITECKVAALSDYSSSGWYASTRSFGKKGGDVCESEGIGILSTQYSCHFDCLRWGFQSASPGLSTKPHETCVHET